MISTVDRFLDFKTDGLRIGILGGSFNPPHLGHVTISEMAINILDLDYVVWLVSPQNPLKEASQFLSYSEKFTECNKIIDNKKIIVSDFELKQEPPYYTFNTLSRIKGLCPNAELFWLMGADNMIQFPKWNNWESIPSLATLVIFDREDFMGKALEGEVAKKFKKCRIVDYKDKVMDKLDWIYIKFPKVSISSTQIREGKID